jgi:glyoxylase-like metal-dependent hydrolase (beta-lactamase superfamily II)
MNLLEAIEIGVRFLIFELSRPSARTCIVAAWLASGAFAQFLFGQQPDSGTLEVLQVQPNFYMIAGAGGNIGVQIGPDGVVLVDAGTQQASNAVIAAIRRLTDQPIRYIIDTSADTDLVGGNGALAKAGRSIYATSTEPLGGESGKDFTNGYAATILAPESLLLQVSAATGKSSALPSDSWPTETFAEKRKYIYFNHEGIEIFRQPAAHSDTDSIILFRGSDVIATGDIVDATRFPRIVIEKGGSIQGEIDALNHVVELAVRPIPFVYESGGTYIIPGHGRIYQQADVVEYRDMIVIIRDIVGDMIKKGMTLDQIKAAAPAKPYERQYGSKSGPWTTNDFVEAVYVSLTKKK